MKMAAHSLQTLALLAQMPPAPEPLPHPEIPAPVQLAERLPWWGYLAGGLVVFVVMALLVWLLVGGRKTAKPLPKRPLQTALRALKALLAEADRRSPADLGHQVSEILRRYYQDRYHIPAPFRTTEELFPPVPLLQEPLRRRQWRERFESLAAFYDALSFAPVPATKAEAVALVETAINKLEEERLHENPLAE